MPGVLGRRTASGGHHQRVPAQAHRAGALGNGGVPFAPTRRGSVGPGPPATSRRHDGDRRHRTDAVRRHRRLPPRSHPRLTGVRRRPLPGPSHFEFGAVYALDSRSSGRPIDNGDNIWQRGRYTDDSIFELQVDHDYPSCLVRGSGGQVLVRSKTKVARNGCTPRRARAWAPRSASPVQPFAGPWPRRAHHCSDRGIRGSGLPLDAARLDRRRADQRHEDDRRGRHRSFQWCRGARLDRPAVDLHRGGAAQTEMVKVMSVRLSAMITTATTPATRVVSRLLTSAPITSRRRVKSTSGTTAKGMPKESSTCETTRA